MLSQTMKALLYRPSLSGLRMFFPERCGFSCWNVTVRLLCSTAHSFEVTSAASSEPHTATNDLDGLNESNLKNFPALHSFQMYGVQ